MGGSLSVCGLRVSDNDRDLQLHSQSKDFARNYQPTSMRGRSVSSTTDSSVASILSNSEQLVPDVYMPKDIQVLSQRRQRHGHHASRSSLNHTGIHSSKGSSRVGNFSFKGPNTIRTVRNNPAGDSPPSANKQYNFGIKTASSSFGYSDDETTDPLVIPSGRMARLVVQ